MVPKFLKRQWFTKKRDRFEYSDEIDDVSTLTDEFNVEDEPFEALTHSENVASEISAATLMDEYKEAEEYLKKGQQELKMLKLTRW